MFLVTAEQMQRMDHYTINEFGIPGRVLMENAGKGAVDLFVRLFEPDNTTRVGVVAGRGNNGGDGFVIARYLMEMGLPVTIFLLSSRARVAGDAKANMDLAVKLMDQSGQAHRCGFIEILDKNTLLTHRNRLVHQEIFVDAMFGTGLNSDVRGLFKEVIDWVNQSPAPVFSVDIPSGLNADTGEVMGVAVKATATATFAFAKAGHLLYPGNEYTGELEIIDIGIPNFVAGREKIRLGLMDPDTIATFFKPRPFDSHKGDFGHVLALAGSPGKTGAAALCANAAARSGAGLVTLGVPQGLNPILEPMVIEPMTLALADTFTGGLSMAAAPMIMDLARDKQALALGPGIGVLDETRELVHHLVKNIQIPMVIDADGLNCLADSTNLLKERKAPTVLTPHPGEMARLCTKTVKQVQADRLGTGSAFAREFGVILVLKGAQTLVCFPDGHSMICPTGNPGMASGGMGDVLTGMIAGFAAQGFSMEKASLAGVFVHGLCGDILAQTMGECGYLASDMIQTIPNAIHDYLLCTD